MDCRVRSILHQPPNKNSLRRAMVHLRIALRLRRAADQPRICRVTVVRFQEIINGRSYSIEALRVDRNRWRAQLVRRPDRATAVMPFYGTTAEEAKRLLAGWLARVAGTAAVQDRP
jgi:hypothetical protein